MKRTMRENLQLLRLIKESEKAPDEVDGIDFAWWTTDQLFQYALKHWDEMNEDTQDSIRFEIRKRIREAYQDTEGSEATI